MMRNTSTSVRGRLLAGIAAVLVVVGAGVAVPQVASAVTNWSVRTTYVSAGGHDAPLRWGRADTSTQTGFGWNHIVAQVHASEATYSFWSKQIERVLTGPGCKKPTAVSGKYTCKRSIEGNPDVVIYVVWTGRVDKASNDGRPVGVITAYQRGENCGC